jgi:hypothetical protein
MLFEALSSLLVSLGLIFDVPVWCERTPDYSRLSGDRTQSAELNFVFFANFASK